MLLHPPIDMLLGDSRWLKGAQLAALEDASPALDGLQRPGLFTNYLRSLSIGEVTVALINQGLTDEGDKSLAVEPLIRRDVVIQVGEQVAAVASTLIGASVIAKHPWLNDLGSKPIGETLEREIAAVRSDIRYCAIAADDPLVANFAGSPVAWGRQYRYMFDGGELSITEVISDPILRLIAELP